MTAPHSTRRTAGHIVGWILGGLLLIAVSGTTWIGVRAALASQHLESARAAAAEAADLLADPSAAPPLIASISADTSAARALTGDPVWAIGKTLPWIGPQLEAVSTVSATLDDVASHALDPLATIAASFSFDEIRPRNGSIDPAPIAAIGPSAAASAEALATADGAIAGIDRENLLRPVREAVDEAGALVATVHDSVDALRRASALMPLMLGADGPRDYLVVFQNNAEWRSLGGNVGAMILLHAEDGALSITAQASSSDFPAYREPVLPLSDAELRLFGSQPATFVQNIAQIPDFTRGGPIAQAMWLRETGTEVDGVISLDPVALSFLLRAIGPVGLPSGDTLSAEDAVELLLNGVYLRYEDPREQDAFFASAAAAVFTALTSGAASPADLLSALARAGAENRLLVWNANPDEQAILDGTSLQGALPSAEDDVTDFGVYVNDATASKMDYYQSLDAHASWCSGDEAQLTVTIRNDAPVDGATLPSYITGGGSHGVPPGSIRTVAYVYLPHGAVLSSAQASGGTGSTELGGGTDAGREVLVWTPELAPGQSADLSVRVHTPQTPDIVIRTTPTVDPHVTSSIARTCDIPG